VSAPGRVLGVDPGSKRIGLAISDPDRKIAFPLATHQRKDEAKDAAFFRQVIAAERIVAIVVGLPLHTDGREGVKAVEARTFGNWLAVATGLPVTYFDERFTTVDAERILWAAGLTHKQRQERRDRLAAQIMLQAYLDTPPT